MGRRWVRLNGLFIGYHREDLRLSNCVIARKSQAPGNPKHLCVRIYPWCSQFVRGAQVRESVLCVLTTQRYDLGEWPPLATRPPPPPPLTTLSLPLRGGLLKTGTLVDRYSVQITYDHNLSIRFKYLYSLANLDQWFLNNGSSGVRETIFKLNYFSIFNNNYS